MQEHYDHQSICEIQYKTISISESKSVDPVTPDSDYDIRTQYFGQQMDWTSNTKTFVISCQDMDPECSWVEHK